MNDTDNHLILPRANEDADECSHNEILSMMHAQVSEEEQDPAVPDVRAWHPED